MSEFVDTPMDSAFVKTPEGYKGGPGTYDGEDCPAVSSYRRTKSPNGVPEKVRDSAVQKPSGEKDQF